MNMSVWNPFREMENMFERYNHATGRGMDTSLGYADWSPTVDIEESDNFYLIRADVPGVVKKDIDVHMENGVLSITGEKHEQKETGKGTKRHRTERYSGSFARRFTLPGTIQANKIDASYKDGVLSLMIPKAEEAKPRSIDIKVK